MESSGLPLVLLVNPSAAGGRTLKLLPQIEAALDERRVEFRVLRTRDLPHGVEAALRAVEAGELPVVVSGDGLIGAIGGAMAGAETALGIIPAFLFLPRQVRSAVVEEAQSGDAPIAVTG